MKNKIAPYIIVNAEQRTPINRFTPVVEQYVRYRPDYPVQVIWFLKKRLVLDADFTVADIGAGTGKSSVLFLPHVRKVYGIEPNDAMRDASKVILGSQENFIPLNGSAEQTGLGDKSVDFIVCAQAFHWFDLEKAKAEFSRVLRQNRPVLLMWNNRNDTASNFMKAYNDFVTLYSTADRKDFRESFEPALLDKFFPHGYEQTYFPHENELDLAGLKGLYSSASYAFTESHPRYAEAMQALTELFYRFEYQGKVLMAYETKLVLGMFNKKHIALWKKVVFHLLRIPAFFAYLFLLSAMFFSSLIKKLRKKLSGG